MSITLPSCWGNDERMNVLFQPFRERSINIAAWEGKMKFWKELITSTMSSDDHRLVVTQNDITELFSRKGRKPACLSPVVQSLVDENFFVVSSQYETELESIHVRNSSFSWPRWGYHMLVQQPIKWAWNATATKLLGKAINMDTKLVHPPNVKTCSDLLLHQVYQEVKHPAHEGQNHSAELLLSRSSVEQICKKHELCKSSDLPLLLKYLEAHQHIIIVSNEYGEFIKFAENKKQVQPVTEVEFGILKLKQAKCSMEKQIESMQAAVTQLDKATRTQVSEGNKIRALRTLKNKKNKEKTLKARMEYLDQLDDILEKIYSADTDKLIIEAYTHGASALKAANSGTSVDQVNQTLDELSEEFNMSQEVTDILSTSRLDQISSTDELEEELTAILDGVEGDRSPNHISQVHQPAKRLPDTEGIDDILLSLDELELTNQLPAVPDHSPSKDSKLKEQIAG